MAKLKGLLVLSSYHKRNVERKARCHTSIFGVMLSAKLAAVSSKKTTMMVIVTTDVASQSSSIQKVMAGTIIAVEPGIYSFQGVGVEILLISKAKTTLSEGCYTVIETQTNPAMPTVDICDEQYFVVNADGLKALIRA